MKAIHPHAFGRVALCGLAVASVSFCLSSVIGPMYARGGEKQTESGQGDPQLATLLREWQQANNAVRDSRYEIRCRIVDNAFGSTEVRSASVLVKKPDLIRVDLADSGGKPRLVVYREGRRERWYDFETRKETAITRPQGYPESGLPDTFLAGWFAKTALITFEWPYMGISVDYLRKHCQLRLDKEDEYWSYVDVRPAEHGPLEGCFLRARIVLGRKDRHVRELWMQLSNSNELKWDYVKSEVNLSPPLTTEELDRGLPTDFKKVGIDLPPSSGILVMPAGK